MFRRFLTKLTRGLPATPEAPLTYSTTCRCQRCAAHRAVDEFYVQALATQAPLANIIDWGPIYTAEVVDDDTDATDGLFAQLPAVS